MTPRHSENIFPLGVKSTTYPHHSKAIFASWGKKYYVPPIIPKGFVSSHMHAVPKHAIPYPGCRWTSDRHRRQGIGGASKRRGSRPAGMVTTAVMVGFRVSYTQFFFCFCSVLTHSELKENYPTLVPSSLSPDMRDQFLRTQNRRKLFFVLAKTKMYTRYTT